MYLPKYIFLYLWSMIYQIHTIQYSLDFKWTKNF